MSELPVSQELQRKLAAVLAGFEREVKGVRAGRPSPALVEDLKVSYYEQTLPLKQIGSLSVSPPRDLLVQVWDKEAVQGVVKSIEASSLGLSAQVEGSVVRLRLPELSRERREELIRHVKRVAEQYRIQIRHIRDEANKEVQKQFDEKALSEDQRFVLRESIQKNVNEANQSIETILSRKIKEIGE